MRKKVLVTGGAGFIGSHVVDALINEGFEVVVVDNLRHGNINNINPHARFYKKDINDGNLLEVFIKEKPCYVYHEAAQIEVSKSCDNPIEDAMINIAGTLNILECCRKTGVRKIIYSSSAAVYGEPKYLPIDEEHPISPVSCYGVSKHTPEHYIEIYNQLYGINYTVLRYANVYGERQDSKGEAGVISIFIDKFMNNDSPVVYGDGNQTRDFIYVKDIVKANLLALEKGDGEIINVGTCVPVSINGLIDVLKEITGKEVNPKYENQRIGDIRDSYMNNDKAKALLGWQPKYDIKTGLMETLKWYQIAQR